MQRLCTMQEALETNILTDHPLTSILKHAHELSLIHTHTRMNYTHTHTHTHIHTPTLYFKYRNFWRSMIPNACIHKLSSSSHSHLRKYGDNHPCRSDQVMPLSEAAGLANHPTTKQGHTGVEGNRHTQAWNTFFCPKDHEKGRPGVQLLLAPWGFFQVESHQWLKNWHSCGYSARRLAL